LTKRMNRLEILAMQFWIQARRHLNSKAYRRSSTATERSILRLMVSLNSGV
jgi:hypothetical protein